MDEELKQKMFQDMQAGRSATYSMIFDIKPKPRKATSFKVDGHRGHQHLHNHHHVAKISSEIVSHLPPLGMCLAKIPKSHATRDSESSPTTPTRSQISRWDVGPIMEPTIVTSGWSFFNLCSDPSSVICRDDLIFSKAYVHGRPELAVVEFYTRDNQLRFCHCEGTGYHMKSGAIYYRDELVDLTRATVEKTKGIAIRRPALTDLFLN
jgi:hypothetical protein